MKNKIALITITSFLLGLSYDWLFFGKIPGISVLIYTSIILGATYCFAYLFKKPLNKSIYWLTSVILFFSLMIFIRANPLIVVLDIFLIIYLLITVARLASQPSLKLGDYDMHQYFSLVSKTSASIVSEFFQVLKKSLSNRNASVPSSTYKSVIRGIFLSLPILILFLILLSSADLVFKDYVDAIFHPNVSPVTIFRWGLIGFVSSLFLGAYAYIFMPSSETIKRAENSKASFSLGTLESSIILGSISFLFFIFLIIQLTYLFGGSGHITSTGHTYAEYARKGFFELIAVATVSLILILNIKKNTKFRTLYQSIVFKWICGVLIAEVMVIMLSAHMRLNLYESAYGFTSLRLLSHIFIFWLAVAFSLLLLHIIKEDKENIFAHRLFVSILCFFALINIINPDKFIAQRNIDRFNSIGKIDTTYLGTLSEDAVPAISRLLDSPNADVKKNAANILYRRRQNIGEESSRWQSANLSRQSAKNILDSKSERIDENNTFIELKTSSHGQ